MFEATQEMLEAARSELASQPAATALRKVARRFQLSRTDLAWLAVNVYENAMTPEVQAIWHWDLVENGRGHNDTELNDMLSSLVFRVS